MHATLFDSLRQFGRDMVVSPAEVILDVNDPPQGAYLVASGRVRLTLVNDEGKALWSRMVGQGAILGLASALGNESHVFRAVAIEPTEMAFIERDRLAKLVRDNPAIGTEILALLSSELTDVRRKWSMLARTGKRKS
jgi:CRP-like cAMP-binding protein